MDLIVGNVENIKFDIEISLEEQHGSLPLPFPGMDSKLAELMCYSVLPTEHAFCCAGEELRLEQIFCVFLETGRILGRETWGRY